MSVKILRVLVGGFVLGLCFLWFCVGGGFFFFWFEVWVFFFLYLSI